MIRKLEHKDITACVLICEQTFAEESYTFDVRSELEFSLGKNCFTHEYYVFEEDGIIKGLGGLMNAGFDDGIYGLCTCYVHRDYRFQKVGYRLTEFRIQRIKELRGVVIQATTKRPWHLERFGFHQVPTNYKTWTLMHLNI